MTVLRSREIRYSSPAPKTLRGKKKSSVSIEPSTPSQPQEPSVLDSSPLISIHSRISPRLGPDSGSSRRSLRLAFKSTADDSAKNGLGSVKLKVNGNSSEEMDTEVSNLGGGEKAGCDFDGSIRGESEVDCGIGSCSEIEVETGEPISVTPENLVKRDDSGPGGYKNSQAKGKRKVNVDFTLPSLDATDENEGSKSFVRLRSGKELLKKGVEGIAEDVDVLCNKGHDNSGEQRFRNRSLDHDSEMHSLEKQNVSESSNAQRRGSRNKGKKKVMETEDIQRTKIDGVEVNLKFEQDKLRANDNQRVSSTRGREKSVVIHKGKRKLNAREKGKTIVDQNCDEGGTLMESEKINIEEKDSAVDLPVLNMEEDQRLIEEEEDDKLKKYIKMLDFRNIASRSASKFAHFDSADEDNYSSSGNSSEREIEEWPGPCYTAMRIIKDREQSNQESERPVLNKSESGSVTWVPKKALHNSSKPAIPSLKELCLKILATNADSISSLDCVPDAFRHRLSQLLCDSRRMNARFFDLLLCESPTEIRLPDCSWLTEEQFVKSFEGCDTSNLMVLQLDNCGRSMADYILPSTLARYPNSLPALTTLSVSGACRLSDVGLSALISSVPALKSLNLSQCSLLTNSSIETLANSLGSTLRELYLTDCQFLDAKHILPALKKFEQLEVLSVAGIQTVSDKFIKGFVTARGCNIKGLILTDCVKLTDSSLKVIAETCSGLRTLDLVNLTKLSDSSLGYLANGCCKIHSLNLRRNAFSDESIAAYLEISGEILEELSLNNIMKVGRNTALSLAKRAKKLRNLDISWCRNLSDETVGLIVDSCLSLRVLKLFGCSQITNVFLEGHSNPNIQIIGCKMSPVLAHFDAPDFERAVMH